MIQQSAPKLYRLKAGNRNNGKHSSVSPFLCCFGLVSLVILLIVGQIVMLRTSTSKFEMKSAVSSVRKTASLNRPPSSLQIQEHLHPQSPLTESSPASLLYNDPPPLDTFPKWIREYVTWHQQIRRQYPGMELFTNPDAPNVLVRTCLGLCGGLHDRLGQLPWDLYLANATGRVLLLAWQRPRSLENFLIPSDLLDWTVPDEAKFGFDDIRRVRNHTTLFEGYPEDHPTDEFWNQDIDAALERANTGKFKDIKILRHRLLGHLGEDALERRLKKVGYTDSIHAPPHFGNIFWLFFRPSTNVDIEVQTVLSDLKLQLYKYSAVHCRVRHPKAFDYGLNVLGKNPKYPADKTGLPWEGQTRQFALQVAAQALECSRDIAPTSPIYFLSDSNDLVRHVTIELLDDRFVQANRTEIDENLHQVVKGSMPILARDVTLETAHLDRQKGRAPEAYFSTFIDLLLAVHASCVVYGVGYYAAFASKISGTNCSYTYAQEAWGAQAEKSAHFCPRHPAVSDKNTK